MSLPYFNFLPLLFFLCLFSRLCVLSLSLSLCSFRGFFGIFSFSLHLSIRHDTHKTSPREQLQSGQKKRPPLRHARFSTYFVDFQNSNTLMTALLFLTLRFFKGLLLGQPFLVRLRPDAGIQSRRPCRRDRLRDRIVFCVLECWWIAPRLLNFVSGGCGSHTGSQCLRLHGRILNAIFLRGAPSCFGALLLTDRVLCATVSGRRR